MGTGENSTLSSTLPHTKTFTEAFAQGSGGQPLPSKEVIAQALRGKSGCQ